MPKISGSLFIFSKHYFCLWLLDKLYLEKVRVVSYTLVCGSLTAGKRQENLKTRSTGVHLNIPKISGAGQKILSTVCMLKRHVCEKVGVCLHVLVYCSDTTRSKRENVKPIQPVRI